MVHKTRKSKVICPATTLLPVIPSVAVSPAAISSATIWFAVVLLILTTNRFTAVLAITTLSTLILSVADRSIGPLIVAILPTAVLPITAPIIAILSDAILSIATLIVATLSGAVRTFITLFTAILCTTTWPTTVLFATTLSPIARFTIIRCAIISAAGVRLWGLWHRIIWRP
jgi:hypothetical protein